MLAFVVAFTARAAEQESPPLRAFECTRPIKGKRADGLQTVRFEPSPSSARLTLEFVGGEAKCSYRAQWRFPESLFSYRPKRHDSTRACIASMLSPFAIACRLETDTQDSRSLAMISELHLRASGTAVERTIAFDISFPSDAVQPPPDARCQALPVILPVRSVDPAFVPSLDASRFSFRESACHFIAEN